MRFKLGQKLIDKIRGKSEKNLQALVTYILKSIKINKDKYTYLDLTSKYNNKVKDKYLKSLLIHCKINSDIKNITNIVTYLKNKNFEFIGSLKEDNKYSDLLFINKFEVDLNIVFENLNYNYFTNLKFGLKKYLCAKQKGFYDMEENFVSDVPIDIMICTCSKDYDVLSESIKSIKKNIIHPIKNIFIISPSGSIEEYCHKNNLTYINEDSFLPIKLNDINYKPCGKDRKGWIFQQLLKLNSDTLGSSDYMLVADSDSVFCQPQNFIDKNNKIIMDISDEYHNPYTNPLNILIPNLRRIPISFVAHHMLFDKKILKEMKADIQKNTNKTWYKAIIDSLDENEISSFSEFETYGNYIHHNYRDRIKLKYWYNIVLQRTDYSNFTESPFYKTISMHEYAQNK